MFPRLFACMILAAAFAEAAPPDTNVRAFGARGDGQADDTAAIQKAIDAGAGGVVFPHGTYRLTGTVTIDLDKTGFMALTADGTARIVMAGPGPAFKFIGTHGGSAAPRDFKPNVWERQRSPMVDGLEIVGEHAEADGIEATGTMQLTVTRTVIREARHGIHLTTRNRNIIIAECHIYHNSGIGVFYDAVDLHQSNIVGSHISYNAGGGVVTRGGAVRNLHIGTCDIESNMIADGSSTANVLIDCTGGSTAEVAITGCTLQHNSNGPDSANIRFLGRGLEKPETPEAEAARWGHLNITGNVLSDVMVNVHLNHARGVTITGNTFGAGHEMDLLVEDCSNVVIGPNSFDRNPRYFTGNNAKARGGLTFRDSLDCTLTGLQINGVREHPAALLLEKCRNFNVSNCALADNETPALLLRDCNDTRIGGCTLRGGTNAALRIEGGSKNWITQNVLQGAIEAAPTSAKLEGNFTP